MKPNLEKALFHRFSFFHPETPITQSLMAFGFECGDGWFDIIWTLCELIEEELKKMGQELSPKDRAINLLNNGEELNFRVDQVKEKYGSLRFYTNWETEKIGEYIRQAEEYSAKTCEMCGSTGVLMEKHGWYKTLCDQCAEKNGYTKTKEVEV